MILAGRGWHPKTSFTGDIFASPLGPKFVRFSEGHHTPFLWEEDTLGLTKLLPFLRTFQCLDTPFSPFTVRHGFSTFWRAGSQAQVLLDFQNPTLGASLVGITI